MASGVKRISAAGEPTAGAKRMAYSLAHAFAGRRTLQLMWFDLFRLRARIRRIGSHNIKPPSTQLHLGSGSRRLAGWLNVDVAGSDYDFDFTRPLPWRTGSFSVVVSQHVIEHLELFGELLPLLSELNRVLMPGGEVWLSCPDMQKICRLYVDGRANVLIEDRLTRDYYSTNGAPPQQIVNDLFHQRGEHKNLFDFDMLKWALESVGFTHVSQVNEAMLLERFPGFPPRHDDTQTLYVTAQAAEARSSASATG